MRRIMSVLCVAALVGVLNAAPAGAGIEQNPNATQFGPAWCEDGRYFESLHSPGGVVGQDDNSNTMGTNHRTWISEDGENFVPLDPPLSRGLERLTVFCYWWDANFGVYIGGDILFNGHGRP